MNSTLYRHVFLNKNGIFIWILIQMIWQINSRIWIREQLSYTHYSLTVINTRLFFSWSCIDREWVSVWQLDSILIESLSLTSSLTSSGSRYTLSLSNHSHFWIQSHSVPRLKPSWATLEPEGEILDESVSLDPGVVSEDSKEFCVWIHSG